MRGRAARLLLFPLLLTSGLVVAGGVGPGVSSGEPALAAQPDADDTRVELLAPGAPPRAPLRITAQVGEVSAVTMLQDLSIAQSIDGRQQRAIPVSASVGMRMTVTAIDAEGNRTATFTYERASVPALNGVGGTFVMTDRGFTSQGSFSFPPGTDPTVEQSLEQFESQFAALSTPFPAEAVGRGARWKVTQHPVLNGIRATQSATYTLVARDGDVLTLRTTIRQKASPQRVDLATLPAGTTATLERSSGTGGGDITMRTSELLPDDAHSSTRVTQVLRIVQGTQRARVRQTVSADVSIQPA